MPHYGYTLHYTKHTCIPQEHEKFSILIPTWNNLAMLKNCISSIRKNSALQHQIIVHINDGSDGTLEYVKSLSGVDYTHTETNIGVCLAMNLMRTMARTDYIAYVNDDMYVCPNWDAALANAIADCSNNYFYLFGWLIEPHTYSCCTHKDFGKTLDTFREDDLLANYESLVQPNRNGGFFGPSIVHKDLWDMAGGYSIEFTPGMGSDNDFIAKLCMLGVKNFGIIGNCLAYHFSRVSTNRISQTNHKKIFVQKYGYTISQTKYLQRYGLAALPRNVVRINRLKSIFYGIKWLFRKNGVLDYFAK